MNKNITLIYFFVFSLPLGWASYAQAPAIYWQKSLGGTSYDYASSIQQTSDGGYIVAGNSQSNDGDVTGNHGWEDYWVTKLDNIGTIEWQKSLGGSNTDVANSIQQTSDGGYIVAGSSESNNGNVTGNHGGKDYWIVKLDNTGAIQWQKSLGGTGDDEANSIQQTSDGGYIVAGASTSNNGDVTGHHGVAYQDYWVVKLDNVGSIEWQKSLGGTGADKAYSIQQTSDLGYIVVGSSNSNDGNVTGNHGGYDYWLVKLDNVGAIQWQKSLGGTDADIAQSIGQTSDGEYIIAGTSNSNDGDVTGNHGGSYPNDFWVVKTDNIGTVEWQKSLGGTSDDRAYSIQQTSDGEYVVAGTSYSNDGDVTVHHGANGVSPDYWIVKLDNIGVIQWEKSLGPGEGRSIQQTSNGGYIIAGSSNSYDEPGSDVTGNHGADDYWVAYLDVCNLTQPSITSSGNTTFCEGSSVTLTSSSANSYLWSNNETTQSISVNTQGAYTVTVMAVNGCTATSTSTGVTVNSNPSSPIITPVGNTLVSSPADNYQWLESGVSIQNANAITYDVTSTGYYQIMITDANGCSSTSDSLFVLITNLEQSVFQNAVWTYPNPVTSEITVKGYSPAYLKLCNTLGQTVAEASKSNKLYVGNLSQGLYVLQVFDEKGGLVKTEKVVKE